MVESNSNTSCDVMKADISLGNSGASNCWTRQMKDAIGELQNGATYKSDLLHCNYCRWSRPCSGSKKSVAYHNWFALPQRQVSDLRAPFVLPEYLKMDLSKKVMRNVARFRI
jgi:hypothetical protein